VHCLKKPLDVEAPRQIGERGAARNQHHRAGPLGFELRALETLRPVEERVLDQRRLGRDLPQDSAAA
jgi:hypothetical protein